VIQQLRLSFAKGTGVDLGAVSACAADNETITAQGPVVCPTKGRIAAGIAGVRTGPGALLALSMTSLPAGSARSSSPSTATATC
jgi:hypothetical protein